MTLIAIVRPPSATLQDGERSHVAGQPIDIACAREQHADYVTALREAGAEVIELPVANKLPDATFVEDNAVVFDGIAVIARSGALSRRAETPAVMAVLNRYCHLSQPPEPATFDGGDVLAINRTVYVGLTERTNAAGVDYLRRLLRQQGYDVIPVPVSGCLHLKSAVTYLGSNTVLINPQWVLRTALAKHVQITIGPHEPMAANALLVGGQLLMSASYPDTLKRVQSHGFKPRPLDISELHRAEAGLTCLSILFETPSRTDSQRKG